MVELYIKNNEIDIELKYQDKVGGKPSVSISGSADLTHHLIEGLFDIVDKLARIEKVGHQSNEWINRRNYA